MRSSATRLTAGMRSSCSGSGRPTVTVVPPRPVARVGLGRARRRCRPSRSSCRRRRRSSSRICLDGVGAGRERLGRAELAGELELLGDRVDADDRAGAREHGADQGREADAAEPEDGDALAGRGSRALDRGADAGQDGASEQRGDVEREPRVDLHGRALGDDDVLAEGGDAEVVVDRLAGRVVEADLAAQQGAGRVRGGARLAERGAPGAARIAVAAGGHEGEHDVVARRRSR